jgi:hypothetical protein
MPAFDPLVVRVARRYVAQIRDERIAREVQRRTEGLVTVRGEEEEDDGDETSAPDPSGGQPQ